MIAGELNNCYAEVIPRREQYDFRIHNLEAAPTIDAAIEKATPLAHSAPATEEVMVADAYLE